MRRRLATKAERVALVEKLKKVKKVVIGNKAVTGKVTPYVEAFKYEKGVSEQGYKYPAAQGFVLSWGEQGKGFGQITFVFKKGQLEIESECMGMDFVVDQVAKLLANAKLKE